MTRRRSQPRASARGMHSVDDTDGPTETGPGTVELRSIAVLIGNTPNPPPLHADRERHVSTPTGVVTVPSIPTIATGASSKAVVNSLESQWENEMKAGMDWSQRCYFKSMDDRYRTLRTSQQKRRAKHHPTQPDPIATDEDDGGDDGMSFDEFLASVPPESAPPEPAEPVPPTPLPMEEVIRREAVTAFQQTLSLLATETGESTPVDPEQHNPLRYISLELIASPPDPNSALAADHHPFLSGDIIPNPSPPITKCWTPAMIQLAAIHTAHQSRHRSFAFYRTSAQISSMIEPVLWMFALVIGLCWLLIRPAYERDHLMFRVLLLYKQPHEVRIFQRSIDLKPFH